MSADIAATLRAARAQIADPVRWTQGDYARLADGTGVHAYEVETGVCWCAVGALRVVVGENGADMYRAALPALAAPLLEALGTTPEGTLSVEDIIVDYNDTHTHADVLALYDRAIAAADQEAPHE